MQNEAAVGPRPSVRASRTDVAQALADALSGLGFRAATGGSPAEAVTLGGRQALTLAATGHAGDCQNALVVAAGEDLLFVQLRASIEAALRALRPQLKAVILSVRVMPPVLCFERGQEGPPSDSQSNR